MAQLPSGYSGGRDGLFIEPSFPELEAIKAQFRSLPNKLSAKYIGSALRRTLAPAEAKLKGNVAKLNRVSGNLKRAIATKVKRYPKTGNAVALVGFVAAGSGKSAQFRGGTVRTGKDRAFHAGFLEFGTKERQIKSSSRRAGASVASSFKTRGAFKIAKTATRGPSAGFVRVSTTPKYPKAFFKKGARGEILKTGQTSIGGPKLGVPPIKDAYKRSLPQMRQLLASEMAKSLLNAIKELANPFPVRKAAA
jgi:hypothetical protein